MSLRTLLPIALLAMAGSVGCSGSPTQADGTVIITQTTSTTTTTVIPTLVAGPIATSPAGTGVASATVFTFGSTPSGGVPPYTLAWNFGDGGAGAGVSPQHAFAAPGTFTTMVTVTDAKGTTATNSAPISIGNVTGRWTASFSPVVIKPENIDIVQTEGAVTATINETQDGFASGTGSVANPRLLSVTATFLAGQPAPYAVTFVGSLNETLQTWTGTVTGYAGCPCTFTATRSNTGLSTAR